jgi:hypothetical protein
MEKKVNRIIQNILNIKMVKVAKRGQWFGGYQGERWRVGKEIIW